MEPHDSTYPRLNETLAEVCYVQHMSYHRQHHVGWREPCIPPTPREERLQILAVQAQLECSSAFLMRGRTTKSPLSYPWKGERLAKARALPSIVGCVFSSPARNMRTWSLTRCPHIQCGLAKTEYTTRLQAQ